MLILGETNRAMHPVASFAVNTKTNFSHNYVYSRQFDFNSNVNIIKWLDIEPNFILKGVHSIAERRLEIWSRLYTHLTW